MVVALPGLMLPAAMSLNSCCPTSCCRFRWLVWCASGTGVRPSPSTPSPAAMVLLISLERRSCCSPPRRPRHCPLRGHRHRHRKDVAARINVLKILVRPLDDYRTIYMLTKFYWKGRSGAGAGQEVGTTAGSGRQESVAFS